MTSSSTEYLTETQEQIVRYVKRIIWETGRSPSLREIAEAAGLNSAGAARYQVRLLEARGVFSRRQAGGRAMDRSIQVHTTW